MAELITNVFAGKEWWGPAHENADAVPPEVAAEIGDHCWDEPPDRPFDVGGVLESGSNRVTNVSGETEGLSAGSAGAPADESADGGPGDDGAATGTAAPEPAPPAVAGGPYQVDGDDLRALARSRGVKIDKRWSEGRLRDEIAKAGPSDD